MPFRPEAAIYRRNLGYDGVIPVDQLIAAAAPGGAAVVKNTTTASFMADVIDASMEVPVVVDFWAPWCGPCRTLGPMLEKAVAATRGAVRMVKLNIDENPDLAQQMRIQSIPAVYAFKDGRPVDGFVGAVAESQIKAFVGRLAGKAGPSPLEEALEMAKQALAEGDAGGAANIFSQILERQPDNIGALVGLARCALAENQPAEARDILARVPADQHKNVDVVAVTAALELAEAAAKASGASREFEARLERDPNDHEARFELATALFASGKREAAVDALLHIVKADRSWNDAAARKQLVKLFEAMGPTDPLTVSARKRLSSVLFS